MGDNPTEFLIQGGFYMARKLIDISHISKSYGDNLVLDDLNLYINENKFLTLLGPSGCGKTTLLRILGGFETPDNGKIIFDGKDITNLAPNKRQLNTVFQKYALFSHMSIADNIAFGLKIKGKSKAYINDKIKYALKLVNLDGFENRTPDSLSGGQQQRIAIARVMLKNAPIIILDEATAFADPDNESRVQAAFSRLSEGKTVIMIAHRLSTVTNVDQIFVIQDGRVAECGNSRELLAKDGIFSRMWKNYQTSVQWKVTKEVQ